MRENILFTFWIFIAFHTFCFAQNSPEKPKVFTEKELKQQKVLIDEKVKFSTIDSDVFASTIFNDSDWKYFDFSSKDVYKKQQVYWFRYYFKVDSALINRPLCLDMSQLGACEIYLDGKKIEIIGKIGNQNSRQFKIKNTAPVTFSVDNTENHVLAIRFLPISSMKKTVITLNSRSFSLEFSLADQLITDKIEATEEFNFYSMLICGIFFALGFIHFLLFIFYRKALYNLFFSTYNLSISLLSYMILLFYKMKDPEMLENYTFFVVFAVVLFGASLSGFVNTLFGKSKKRLKVMLIIAACLIGLFFYNVATAFSFAVLYLFFAAFESFYLIIKAMIRKEKSAFIVGGGVMVFFVFIVFAIVFMFLNKLNTIDIGNALGDDFVTYVLAFIFISFPVSISAYLGWQFAATNLSLVSQLDEVNRLSNINLKQEQEKQQILQDQNDLLEKQVDERTFELQKEKQKTENLLLNILPHEVAEELKENGSSEAKYYDEVTVLFTDFVNFTQSSEKMGAEKMLVELNECFTAFDMIMEKHGLEKIKTIGDAYLAVCGLPLKNKSHAYQTILVALDIIDFIEQRKKTNPDVLDIRIGINSGSLIAGIVGVKKFAYDIWGDTVNTAARMEQNSDKGKINISESTYQLVKDDFTFEFRGKIETKGKGAMEMYFVTKS